MTQQEILSALQKRYAVKAFDPSKKVSDENLKTILESARLSPSSFGIEPWKFLVVNNPELRAKMRAAGFDQPKFTEASNLIVIAYRTDGEALPSELVARTAAAQSRSKEDLARMEQMLTGAITNRPVEARNAWLKAQTYIALGIILETAALLDVDACPMEGFDAAQIDTILGLKEKNLSAATIVAVGYRGNDPFAALPKVRRPYDEVVEVMN